MKRRSLATLVLALILVVMSGAFAFAAEDTGALVLKSSYPKDGQKNTSIENVGVKLNFNHSINGEATKKHNAKCVKIINSETGKRVPIKVLTSDDTDGMMLVLADSTDKKLKLQSNTKYELVISSNFMDDQGNELGHKETVSFTTYNQTMNTVVNTVMMVLMFGGITVIMIKQQREQAEEKARAESAGKNKKETFNPYKEAKRTGKSVEEVIEEEKKRQAKADKKAAREAKKKETAREKVEAEYDLSEILPYVYKVHKPQSITAAGGKFRSGRGTRSIDDIESRNGKNSRNSKKNKK